MYQVVHAEKRKSLAQNATKSYSNAVSSSIPILTRDFNTQTELTWPINLTSPVLLDLEKEEVDEKSVQAVEPIQAVQHVQSIESVQTSGMDYESANLKRGRGSSDSSLGDDLPSLTGPPSKKNFNKLKDLIYLWANF